MWQVVSVCVRSCSRIKEAPLPPSHPTLHTLSSVEALPIWRNPWSKTSLRSLAGAGQEHWDGKCVASWLPNTLLHTTVFVTHCCTQLYQHTGTSLPTLWQHIGDTGLPKTLLQIFHIGSNFPPLSDWLRSSTLLWNSFSLHTLYLSFLVHHHTF